MNLTKEVILRIFELQNKFVSESIHRVMDVWNPTDPIIIEYKKHIDSEGFSNELYDEYISKFIIEHFDDKTV